LTMPFLSLSYNNFKHTNLALHVCFGATKGITVAAAAADIPT